MSANPGYTCRCCGEHFAELPLHYVWPAPAYWYAIPENERAGRCELSSDQCVIDDTHFFILGNLEIPVTGSDQTFSYDVWASLSLTNFVRATELWHQNGRESEPPYFGWLSTSIPGYPETLSLKTHVCTRSVGLRPLIELEPTGHPLASEQREGITWERVQEIAERLQRHKAE